MFLWDKTKNMCGMRAYRGTGEYRACGGTAGGLCWGHHVLCVSNVAIGSSHLYSYKSCDVIKSFWFPFSYTVLAWIQCFIAAQQDNRSDFLLFQRSVIHLRWWAGLHVRGIYTIEYYLETSLEILEFPDCVSRVYTKYINMTFSTFTLTWKNNTALLTMCTGRLLHFLGGSSLSLGHVE